MLYHCSFYGQPTDYAMWTTNATTPAMMIDFSSEFATLYQDPTRTGWQQGSQYTFHASFRPQTQYLRVWVSSVATGAIVQDSGDLWDPSGVNVCRATAHSLNALMYLCCRPAGRWACTPLTRTPPSRPQATAAATATSTPVVTAFRTRCARAASFRSKRPRPRKTATVGCNAHASSDIAPTHFIRQKKCSRVTPARSIYW